MAKKKSFRKLLAAAFALTLVGGMGAAATANAATGAPWDAANANQKGSISIYKMKDGTAPAGKDQYTMTPEEVPDDSYVAGAGFTVTPVTKVLVNGAKEPVDLKNIEDWNKISKVVEGLNKNSSNTDLYDLGSASPEQKTSDTNKVLKFDGLAIGLYRVVETTTPAGYSSADPFFITIPQITGKNSAAATYNYNVNVFPKNKDQKDSVTKDAKQDSFVGPGDTIKYTITANFETTSNTTPLTAANYKGYAIFDDAEIAAYASITEAAVTAVTVDNVNDALIKGTDYTVEALDSAANLEKGRKRVIVKFTEVGLKKIFDSTGTKKVSVAIEFKLADNLPDSINNKSGFIPGNNTGDNPPIVPGGNGDEGTEFGKFEIVKVDAKDNTTKLANAKFMFFADEADANKCAAKPGDATECAGASKIGELTTNGNGKTDSTKKFKVGAKFWAVETAAPSNDYVLPGKAVEITVARSAKGTCSDTTKTTRDECVAVEANTWTYDAFSMNIENVKKADSGNWFNLPKTGAIGVGIFALLGAGLVAGGTTMHMRSRRRENA
ncbi:SpaH/EbpB family LPXTG-anchored major pilin [Pauljensenia sp. OF14-1SRA]|uniref:SpaH/EbpB family LPXTG-anchored major pilin n=1 Tax=Pauljensenia sp. OF14-1SRA TaxID=2998062 RepID=UPI0022DF7D83|nr:SpaH/EbpB family LPXTG-anchored major pilin [Pauljensenia sp. OF14-1SRA]